MSNFYKIFKVTSVAIMIFIASAVNATDYYVATTGSDGNDGLTSGAPKATLDNMFDTYDMTTGDIIHVAAGTYTESSIWPGSNDDGWTIDGAGQGSTIFDGDIADEWMYLANAGNSSWTISDLTIRDYSASSGAIQCRSGTKTGNAITRVTFDNNESTSDGGSAVQANSTGSVDITFTDCIFTSGKVTTPYDGAAVNIGASTASSDFDFDGCKFYANEAVNASYGDGGAVSCQSGTMDFTNCLFYENTSYRFGAVLLETALACSLMNCTIADNTSTTSYGGIYVTNGTVTVTNCIINGNSNTDIYEQSGTATISYSQYDAQTNWTLGSGNSTTAPTFTNSASDDYSITSSSIGYNTGTDTGAPSVDIDDNVRSGGTDMGCYEVNCSSASAPTASSATNHCTGTTTTVSISGGSYDGLQWQSSTDDATWGDISSETSGSYTSGSLTADIYYRMKATCSADVSTAYSASIKKTIVSGGTEYVATTGSDSNPGTSGSPWLTMTYAIANVQSCIETLSVAAGTYTDEDIAISDGQITSLVISGAGIGSTIMDGDGSGRFVNAATGTSTTNITFEDMTVQQYGYNGHGGAFYIQGGTGWVFQDISFETCSTITGSTNDGGAIYIDNAATMTVKRCTFRANYSQDDGSAIAYSSTANSTINNCLFYDNVDYSDATYFQDGSGTVTMFNCTFTENQDYTVYNTAGTTNLTNCIIDNNSGTYDTYQSGTINLTNCIYDNNWTLNSNTSGSTTAPGFVDAANNDFDITNSGQAYGGGTNTGAPTEDLTGETRPLNTTTDVGAYEYGCSDAEAPTVATASTVCAGSTSGAMTISGGKYDGLQWQSSSDNSTFNDVSGQTSDTYTSGALTATTYYRMKATCSTNSSTDYSTSIAKTVAAPVTKYVATTGSNGNAGTSGAPYLTLTYALTQITCGDTIDIAAGTYADDDDCVIPDALGGSLNIRGQDGYTTIFDGGSVTNQRFMKFTAAYTFEDIHVSKLKIQNYGNSSTTQDGGAIYLAAGDKNEITFDSLWITGCSLNNNNLYDGAAIYTEISTSIGFKLTRSIISGNYGEDAPIMTEGEDSVLIENCLFYENTSIDNGSAIYHAAAASWMDVNNCTFADNSGVDGVINQWDGDMIVANCIFYNNASTNDLVNQPRGGMTFYNTCYDAKKGTITDGGSNITTDPTFTNSASDDYSLTSTSVGKDAGSSTYAPADDITGTARPFGGTDDMGAYEYACSDATAPTVGTSATVCSGVATGLTTSGGSYSSLQWQSSSNNSTWANIDGETSTTYTTPAITSTTYYRVVATCSTNSSTDNATSVTLTVDASVTKYVATTGSNGNAGTSGAPYLTLTYAVTQATCGDTIDIAAGTYSDDDNVAIPDALGGSLTIRGQDSYTTIFDGGSANVRFMLFTSGYTFDDIKVEKLKITNYSADAVDGAAIFVNAGDHKDIWFDSLWIETCSTSSTTYDGGAISTVTGVETGFKVSRSVFKGNYGGDGSCINHVGTDTVTVENCLFYDNDGSYADVYMYNSSGELDVWNCTFTENITCTYGNVMAYYGVARVGNCVFYNNSGSYDLGEMSGTITAYNTMYQTSYGTLGNGGSNITTAPTFTDAASDDFTLASGSNGLDAGSATYAPAVDIIGTARPAGGTDDMGCYELKACQGTATWDGSSSTVWALAANWDINEIPCGGPVVIADVANDPVLGNYQATCSDLTINSGGVLTLNATNASYYLKVTDDIVVTGTLTHSGTVATQVSGTAACSGTGTQTTAKWDVISGGNATLSDSWSVDDFTVSSGGTASVADTKTLTVADEFNNAGTFTLTASADLDVNDNFTNSGTFTANTGDVYVANNFTNSSTYTVNTSTNHFDGSENSVITDADGITFNILTINKAATADIVSCNSSSDDVTVTNAFTITEGTMSPGAADFTASSTTTLTDGEFISSTGVTTFTGAITMNNDAIIDCQSTSTADYITTAANIDMNGTAKFEHTNSGTEPIRLTGTQTITCVTGANSSTANFKFYTGSTISLSDDWTIADLSSDGSGGAFTVATTKTLTLSDDLDLNASGMLTATGTGDIHVADVVDNAGTITMNTGDFYCGGNYTNSGTYTSNTSKIHFDGTAGQTINETGITVSYPGSGGQSTIFDGTNQVAYGLEPYFNYGITQQIYLQSDIGSGGDITHISFKYDGYVAEDRTIVVYMGHTSSSSFATTSSWLASGSLTQVFSGALSVTTTAGWFQITLDNAFTYNNSDNLIIAIDDNTGSYVSSSAEFYHISGKTSRVLYQFSDTDNRTFTSPGSGTIGSYVMDLKLTMSSDTKFSLSNEFYDVIINNTSSAGVSLNDEIGWSNDFTLTDGVITNGGTAYNDTIYIEDTTSSKSQEGSSSCFFNNVVVKQNIKSGSSSTYHFPMGKGTASTDYMRMDFVLSGNMAGVEAIEVKCVPGITSGYVASELTACSDQITADGTTITFDELSTDAYFDIDDAVGARTSGSYGMHLYTANYITTNWQDDNILVVKRPSGSTDDCAWNSTTGTYPNDGATGRNKADAYLKVDGFTTFSEVVPGGDFAAALPIDLISFGAEYDGKLDIVNLEWATATEENNEKFVIERSDNMEEIDDLMEVPGAGFSIVRVDYKAVDEDPLIGTSYYRLRQVDYDGQSEHSDWEVVENAYMSNLVNFKVYYTNDRQSVVVSYNLGIAQEYEFVMYNVVGKKIVSEMIQGAAGDNEYIINLGDLPQGAYFIRLQGNNELFSEKIMKATLD